MADENLDAQEQEQDVQQNDAQQQEGQQDTAQQQEQDVQQNTAQQQENTEDWEKPEWHDEKYVDVDRFNKVYGRMKHYERQLESSGAQQGSPEAKKAPDNGKPSADSFEHYEDYIDALIEWKESSKVAVEQTREFDRKMAAGLAKHDDFEEVVYGNSTLPITQQMVEALREFDDPAEIAYYLGKNVSDARKISQMTPTGIIKSYVAIESKLRGAKPKVVSKAPEPTGDLTGGSPSVDLDKMPIDDYIEYMNKKAFGG